MKKIDITVMCMLLLCPSFIYAKCTNETNGTCRTWQNSGICGTNCSFSYNDITGILTVFSGENATINSNFFNKKYYENDAKDILINKIILDGEFSVGSLAFENTYADIYGKNGNIYLKQASSIPFGSNTLYGNILFSDSTDNIAYGALMNTSVIGNIIIHENIENFGRNSFRLRLDGQIFCGTDDCKKK